MSHYCPKCRQLLMTDNDSCPSCGIVFAKFYSQKSSGQASIPKRRNAAQDNVIEHEESSALAAWLFDDAYLESQAYFWGRCLILLLFSYWSMVLIYQAFRSEEINNSWLHQVNLPFHEAGHLVFRPFGQFIMSLGGTLGQLIMPLICLFTLLIKTRDPFGAAICFWWFGENFLDIAPYVNDARDGVLPLLGGNFGNSAPYGFHDWNYLLNESGLLNYDHTLAHLACYLGSMIMLLAMGWSLLVLVKQRHALS